MSCQDLREPTPSPRRRRGYLQRFWDATQSSADARVGRRAGLQVETPAQRRNRADLWRLARLAAPDHLERGT